jgi:hypothetical protein
MGPAARRPWLSHVSTSFNNVALETISLIE